MITIVDDGLFDSESGCFNTLDCVKVCFEDANIVILDGSEADVFLSATEMDLIRDGSQLCINGHTFNFGFGENFIPVLDDQSQQILEIIQAIEGSALNQTVEGVFFFPSFVQVRAKNCFTDISLELKQLSGPPDDVSNFQSFAYFDEAKPLQVREDYNVQITIDKEDGCPLLCYNIPPLLRVDCKKCLLESLEACKDISAGIKSLSPRPPIPLLHPAPNISQGEIYDMCTEYTLRYTEYYDGTTHESMSKTYPFVFGSGEYLMNWRDEVCAGNLAAHINMYEGVTICHDQDLLLQFKNPVEGTPSSLWLFLRFRGDQGQLLLQDLIQNNGTTSPDFYEENVNPCAFLTESQIQSLVAVEYVIALNGQLYQYDFPVACCDKKRVQLLFLTQAGFYKTLMFCFEDSESLNFFNENLDQCECCDCEAGTAPIRNVQNDFQQTLNLRFLSKKHYNDLLLCELYSSKDIFITDEGKLYPVTIGSTELSGTVSSSNNQVFEGQTLSVSLNLNKKI